MKISHFKTLSIATAAVLCSHAAAAGTWSLGASALVDVNPYKGYDTKVLPVPIISYEGDDFYFHTLTAGYYLWKDDQNKFSLTATYIPFGFKPDDSDDSQMKRLDKRRGTLMAGLAYSHIEDWGTIRTTFNGDVLDNSDGMVADLAYLYTFHQDNWALVPGIGVQWSSSNENQYYYGINSNESRRSGLSSYSPDDSFSPYLELSAKYDINKDWQAFFMGRYIRLDSEVKDSPMVDKSYSGMLWTGVTYSF
ncbi:MipA/OmpV family protein [Ewingella allii]|uniref:MipA/OmpV family protein n=1 Tax=Ewingella allii TaxID=3092550 RepID=UPI00378DEDFA